MVNLRGDSLGLLWDCRYSAHTWDHKIICQHCPRYVSLSICQSHFWLERFPNFISLSSHLWSRHQELLLALWHESGQKCLEAVWKGAFGVRRWIGFFLLGWAERKSGGGTCDCCLGLSPTVSCLRGYCDEPSWLHLWIRGVQGESSAHGRKGCSHLVPGRDAWASGYVFVVLYLGFNSKPFRSYDK